MKTTIAVLDKQGGNAKLTSYDELHCLRLADAAVVFDGRVYAPATGASGAETIAKKLEQADSVRASEAFLKQVEGDFSFIIAEHERIIAGRDPIGVQPLYYGETPNLVALASNRKALWKLGIDKPRSFPPGNLGVVSREGFKFKPIKTLVYPQPKQVTMQEASENLQKLLEKSVRSRVLGAGEVAVAFSGGLDSSVVAFLAKKCKADVRLVHVSLENQAETEAAKEAADALGLPLQVVCSGRRMLKKLLLGLWSLLKSLTLSKQASGCRFSGRRKKLRKRDSRCCWLGRGQMSFLAATSVTLTSTCRMGRRR